MKKRQYYVAILTVCSLVLLSGCGKKNSRNNSYNSHSNYTPSTVPMQTTTTAPANAPKVNLNNLVITAGSEIDYMSAIVSVENMELSKSMVSINSANVDRFTPGNYTVYYTFDYMGQTVKSFIVVTVVENTEQTTTSPEISEISTETSSTDSSEQTSDSSENSNETEGESSSEEGTSNAESSTGDNQNETSSSESNSEGTSSENNNGALNSTVYHSDLPIPDAVFTLSTGETVTIKNTPERYIVETFTEDSYYTEDNEHYLQSELKVLMNTGEVQTVEMVITRVSGIPEESSFNSETN